MKEESFNATVFLTYSDDSETCFEFQSSEDEKHALATLYMVCRGTLMASSAVKCTAYNEEGFEYCSYVK